MPNQALMAEIREEIGRRDAVAELMQTCRNVFDTIPHDKLLKTVASRVANGLRAGRFIRISEGAGIR